jgi:hypothetical protein
LKILLHLYERNERFTTNLYHDVSFLLLNGKINHPIEWDEGYDVEVSHPPPTPSSVWRLVTHLFPR